MVSWGNLNANLALLANGVFPLSVGGMQKFTTCSVSFMLEHGLAISLFHEPENGCAGAAQIHEVFLKSWKFGVAFSRCA